MTGRQERVMNALVEQIGKQSQTLSDLAEATREQRREFVEEMRAQRAGLVRMLDPFDEGGSAAGA
jgi:hypothetical protein